MPLFVIQSVRFSASIRSSRVGVGGGRRVEKCRCVERVGTFRPGSFDGVFRVALTSHEPRIDGPTHACRVSTGVATFRTSMYVYTVWKCVSTQKRDGSQGEEDAGDFEFPGVYICMCIQYT